MQENDQLGPGPEHIVVVGGGHAAAQLVDSLRQKGHTGPITLIGEEPCLPYQRPPLSKQYLAGSHEADWLSCRPEEFYSRHAITTLVGRRVVEIDRRNGRLRLDDGRQLGWDRLALTIGARVRRLEVPGAERRHVYYLRTIDDARRIRTALHGAKRVAIIGGGFIGLEVAAVLVQASRDVTVLEAEDRILPRVVAPLISEFFHDHHTARGVRIVTNVRVSGIGGRRNGSLVVECQDTAAVEADLVLVGIGIRPNIELAERAGLVCDDGISVDECGRTSDPNIVAAGDCTVHPNALLERRLRLETVHNAVEQARSAAAALVGQDLPYRQTPWVWSDQYDLRLQSVGATEGCDHHAVRGDPRSGRFSLFYFSGERLCAASCVNRSADFAATRRILDRKITLTPQQAADPGFDLQNLAPRRTPLEFRPPWPPRARRVRAAP